MQKSLWHQPRNRPRPLTSTVIAQKISNFSYFFWGLYLCGCLSETEKFGKLYLCVFQSFTLAKTKIGVRCTLSLQAGFQGLHGLSLAWVCKANCSLSNSSGDNQIHLDPANSNSVISNFLLFQTQNHFPWIWLQVFTISTFELLLFQTIFPVPSEFEIVGFSCIPSKDMTCRNLVK